VEFWTTGVASARGAARTAQEIEAAGWDGMLVVDSQNLSGDPYISLALAATVTTRIGLGPGVTNSVTRHAAATATAIASVHRISNGRAVLGIGRGDSALAHLGRAPARLAQFERYLRHLQIYLSGGSVSFDEIDISADFAPPLAGLHLHDAPPASCIGWIADGLERGAKGGSPQGSGKVPVEVAASGPKVIALAALHAERVMFTLGADTERLAWGIALAKKTRKDAGLDPDAIAFGAYVNLGCHNDMGVARSLVRGGLTTFARFSVMHGKANGPVSAKDADVLQTLRNNYDMKKHTQGDSRQAGTLTDDFVDRFAIVGTPDRCIERLRELAKLGLDKVAISGGMRGVDAGDAAVGKQLVAEQVLPGMRS
jgi:5,10-methylenetetrahydromethanopterin reductase